jgi:hypothetical protein
MMLVSGIVSFSDAVTFNRGEGRVGADGLELQKNMVAMKLSHGRSEDQLR